MMILPRWLWYWLRLTSHGTLMKPCAGDQRKGSTYLSRQVGHGPCTTVQSLFCFLLLVSFFLQDFIPLASALILLLSFKGCCNLFWQALKLLAELKKKPLDRSLLCLLMRESNCLCAMFIVVYGRRTSRVPAFYMMVKSGSLTCDLGNLIF